ncbi:MAG: hypothetical protein IIA89_13445 [Chloroflexi bacterium]|nr:hypothetical protein [Chloroflexota bacterium]
MTTNEPRMPEWIYSGQRTADVAAFVTRAGVLRAVWLTAPTGNNAQLDLDDGGTDLLNLAVPSSGSVLFVLPQPIPFLTDLGSDLTGTNASYGVWFE